MEKHRISSDFLCKSYYSGTLQELPQATLGEAQRPTVREGKFNWQVPCDNMCKREPRCWQSVMHISQTWNFEKHSSLMSSLISKREIFVHPLHVLPQRRGHVFLSSLVSAAKLHPFLLSRSHLCSLVHLCFERVVIFPCYCMISQNLPSQPLKRWRTDQSWVIPAVSPQSA